MSPSKFLTPNPNINRLSYGFALLFVAIGSILQYITPYFHAQGDESMGFHLLILLYFCIFLSNFTAPYFITRFGSQKMFVVTALLYILSIIMMIMKPSWIIYSGTILLGFAGAILWNSQNNYLVGISKVENLGANSGFFVAVYGVGYASGIFLLGYLIDIFSYTTAFYMIILFGFGGLYLFGQMEPLESERTRQKRRSIFTIKSPTPYKAVLSSSFIQSILFGLAVSLVPLHIQIVTESSSWVGMLSSIFFLMPLLLSIPIGRFSDRNGRAKVILVGIAMALLGLLAFHTADTLWGLITGMVAISIAQAILFPMFIALQGDLSTPPTQPLVTNLFVLFKYIGMMFGIALSNFLGIELTYLAVMGIIVVILLFSFGVMQDDKVLRTKVLEEMEGS